MFIRCFFTLYTTLPYNLIKDKLVDSIEIIVQREGLFTLHVIIGMLPSHLMHNLWSFQKVCEALSFLLDNIYIRCGSELYRRIVSIQMGNNCARLIADLFFFC